MKAGLLPRPVFCGLSGLLGAALAASYACAEPQLDRDFKADEPVSTITVEIHVGADGQDLQEPVALDLGLGFPLLLYPVGYGQAEGEIIPFGAVPQASTAESKIAAGASATFSFSLSDEAGQDSLGTTPQLLAGVRIGDIKRIGLASPRSSPWLLDGYQILVNGKAFAARKPGAMALDPAQKDLRAKLADLDSRTEALQKEYFDLEERAKANQATEAETKRMEEIVAEGTTLVAQQEEIRSQWRLDASSAQETLDADRLALSDVMAQIESILIPTPAGPAEAETPIQTDTTAGPKPAADAQTPAEANTPTEANAPTKADATVPVDATAPDQAVQAGAGATEEALRQQASAEDLQEIADRTEPLEQQKKLLEGRIQGRYPWFVDEHFQPPWPSDDLTDEGALVKKVEVTAETCDHAGASTQNYVYFRTGARKYLLNDLYRPLSAEYGPQKFEINLAAGPLSAADLRGWAVGMLGSPTRFGKTPDRWHPQRILVEVDGQFVYDSDEHELDRFSLAAIRLIPPKHLDLKGDLQSNTPGPRETYVWEAGEGLGLDLVNGGAIELPPQSDPNFPGPEPGWTDNLTGAEDMGTDLGSSSDYPLFPGESNPGPGSSGLGGYDQGLGGYDSGMGGYDQGWGAYDSGMGGYDPGLGGFGPGGGDFGLGGGNFGLGGSQTFPNNPAQPFGDPFQLHEAWISKGWKLDEPFTIEWRVTGDLSAIDHFLVRLRVFRPEESMDALDDLMEPAQVPTSQRNYLATVDPAINIAKPYYYVAPEVTAVTNDPGQQDPPSNPRRGPAVAVFPAGSDCSAIQPVPKDFTFEDSGGTTSAPTGLALSGPPAPGQRSAWFAETPVTPRALSFGVARPASHVAAHLTPNDKVTVRYESVNLSGKYRLLMHLGFMGNSTAADSVNAAIECLLKPPQGAPESPMAYTMTLNGISSESSLLSPKDREINTADLFGAAASDKKATLEVKVTLTGGGWIDPNCAPGIFGLRLLPAPAGNGDAPQPVNADIGIDRGQSWPVPGFERFVLPPKDFPPHVAIINNGPDTIPAETLQQIKVHVIYYLGQYGNKPEDVFKPDEIECLKDITDTWIPGGGWQGPLPILPPSPPGVLPTTSQSFYVVPTGHPRLGDDGRLLEKKAWKVVRVWYNLCLPGEHLLKDENPDNNHWMYIPDPPVVIGEGPLDYEVLAFPDVNFGGEPESYELNPDLMRQKDVWDLSQEPGKKDMYQKIRSLQIGKDVDLYASKGTHFFRHLGQGWNVGFVEDAHPGFCWVLTQPGPAKQPSGVPAIGSMILCPKSHAGPIGVEVACETESKLLFTEGARSQFFPWPDRPGQKPDDVTSLLDTLNDDVDFVYAWRSPTDVPTSWVKVTLYEDANLGGGQRTLPPPFNPSTDKSLNIYRMEDFSWEGMVVGFVPGLPTVNIQDEVSSLKFELIGQP